MTDENEHKDVLKTFDMYHFFSRTDVILAILAVLALLGYTLYAFLLSSSDVT